LEKRVKDVNRKIGIMGGTFNPVHFGHLRVAEEVRERFGFRKILFVPSGNPPLKTGDLADASHRYEMTGLAIQTNPCFALSDIECRRGEKSYTVETMVYLRKEHPGYEPYFILGIDSFLDVPHWYQPERLMELTHFVVVSRPGFLFSSLSSRIKVDGKTLSELDSCKLDAHMTHIGKDREIHLINVTPFGVSATTMRALIREGMSIKYLLPETVESYIIANKIYSEGSGHL
jgi:nicotinate-nucleotide adenylyltransferase